MDYFSARYYSSAQGRFTSTDPLLESGNPYDPQSWNRYSYSYNNPLRFIDSTGMQGEEVHELSHEIRYQNPAFCFECWWHAAFDNGRYLTDEQFHQFANQVRVFLRQYLVTYEGYNYVGFDYDSESDHDVVGLYDRVKEDYENGKFKVVTPEQIADLVNQIPAAPAGVAGSTAPKQIGNARMNLLNRAENSKLRNIINDLYRKTAQIGNGSTADVIRYERNTGILKSPSGHIPKGKLYLRSLENLVRSGNLNSSDRAIANEIINDLRRALRGVK